MGRKNELTARIAELTELLEELKSEREMLLANMECTDGKDAPSVRKKVKLMETDLKNLDVQEQKPLSFFRPCQLLAVSGK